MGKDRKSGLFLDPIRIVAVIIHFLIKFVQITP